MHTQSKHFAVMGIWSASFKVAPGDWTRRGILAAMLLVMFGAGFPLPAKAGGASATNDAPRSVPELTLEQLINIPVTSVAKKETPLQNSPAAISVVTADDISRLGITSLPDALRLVPGMDVAQIDANEWSVSIRGFNSELADKLLVLVDGRSVYTPASGGVFWGAQNIMMDDLDRIEVIRGPGATLWGANAVDGVINIVTKSARETQGGLVTVAGGSEAQPISAVRYGGEMASNLYYRVYAQRSDFASYPQPNGVAVGDQWNYTSAGFRMDYEPPTQNTLTLQGDYYGDEAGKPTYSLSLNPPGTSYLTDTEHNEGGNILGRWTHDFSPSSKLTLQSCYDHVEQGDGSGQEYQNSYDVDLQEQFSIGSRNDFMVGTGYRDVSVGITPSLAVTWTPETRNIQTFNLFAQDDITLVPDRLHLILGSKLEYDTLIGWEPQPDVRLIWMPADNQRVWAGVSRATATPPLYSLDSRVNYLSIPSPPPGPPVLVSILPNSILTPESLIAYQAGYRIEPARNLSFDLTGFYNVYDDLIVAMPNPASVEASPAPSHLLMSDSWQNAGRSQTYGVELAVQWQLTEYWRWVASYSWLDTHQQPETISAPQKSPEQQVQLRSYLDLPFHLQLNGALYFVDRSTADNNAGNAEIPAYLRADLGLVWHPRPSLDLGIWGENLTQRRHLESLNEQSTVLSEVPRSILAKLTLRF
jgi:iron complex outermembrane receptor protein